MMVAIHSMDVVKLTVVHSRKILITASKMSASTFAAEDSTTECGTSRDPRGESIHSEVPGPK
jgi:hypothetical protein